MLRSTKSLRDFAVRGTDGPIGQVHEFYFDDERWTVRYIVVETGTWLGRRVLISPMSFKATDWPGRAVDLSLTKERIRNSPDADLESPISRQYELGLASYYGFPPYWGGAGLWGTAAYPGALSTAMAPGADPVAVAATRPASAHPAADSHLRSSRSVMGHHIRATDGEIGHLDDLIIDDETWAVRYLRVDTSNWIGGKAVLVPRDALGAVNWLEQEIHVGLTKDQVYNSPEYDPARLYRDETPSKRE